jgi:flagellar protein FlbD
MTAGTKEMPMIKVTRLNGKEFVVNAEMIQFMESTPDTVITLSNKEKIVVKEGVDDLIKRVVDYNRSVRGPVSS